MSELLGLLSAQGVGLWFEGDRLRFRSPKGALTPEQRAELGAKRAEVLAHLRAEAARTTTTRPLSFSQRSLWFVNREAPDSAAYNVGFAARIVSSVDVAAVRQALQALCDRHASLRTTFPIVDGIPVQRISGVSTAVLELHDVADDDETRLHARVMADYHKPFDLEHGPVFRTALYSRARQDHVLLLVVHHIAADGWSLLQLLEELRALYAEATGGPAVSNARPPVEYAQFTQWQTGMLAGDEGKRLANYWRTQMASPRAELELPADRPRPPRRSTRGGTLAMDLGEATSARVRQMAKDAGATLFVVLLAAFKTLLYRYTGTDDVVVGTPTFGRSRPEFARVIGNFVNTIPLRSHLDPALRFSDFVGRLKKTVLDALEAQDYPFPLLVEQLQPVRDSSRSPLFEILFVLQRFDQLRELEPVLVPGASDAWVSFGGLRLTHYPLDQQEGQFDLTLQVVDRSGPLALQFKYNLDLFDEQTIAALSQHFRVLLDAVTTEPKQALGRVPLLTAAERARVTREFNATSQPIDATPAFVQFERQAARTPSASAVAFEGELLSYGALNARANRLAHRLRHVGVVPGVNVGLCLERSPDLVVAVLGIHKAGGAFVPLDPGFPTERLSFMLSDSEAAVLLTAGDCARGIEVPDVVHVLDLDAEADVLVSLSDENLESGVQGRDIAYVIYTSGSTGRPKGVAVSHLSLANFLWSMRHEPGLAAADTVAAVTTISFDIALLDIFLPLVVGARIELMSRQTATDGAALAQRLGASGATVLQATPATWRLLVEAGWKAGGGFRALCGGEALPRDLASALLDRVDELWNLYGPTETTVWSTVERVSEGPITVGRPIANTQIYVVDKTGDVVPLGVAGEIWIGGDGVAAGYHRRPELSAERFVPDHFSDPPGARLYRTGDLGRWGADGRLHHVGRLDHQVKIRGFRIELGEIESVLCLHPQVREAIVLAISDTPDQQRLVAYVVGNAPVPVVSDLREHLRKTVPDYMVPSAFVLIDKLPLTNNGKVDRKALPAPDAADTVATDEYQAPVTETEKGVAQVFAEVLNIPAVGLRNNFFELGGHSLLATRTLARLRERFEIYVPLTAIFQAPTVEGLSRWLDAALEKPGSPAQLELAQVDRLPRWKCLVPVPSNSSRPPLFLITGYGDEDDTMRALSNLISHLGPDQPLCGLRPRWLDGHSPQYSSVAEMRDEYLRELRAFQPEGPYYLLGECVGGVVAVEMARTLLEQGDEVALLILVDTERPRFHSFLLNRLLDRGHHVASVLRQFVRPTEGTRSQVVSDVVRRKLRRAGLRKHPITATDYLHQNRIEYQRLLKKHRLKRYPGRIRLIVSDDGYRFVRLLGWNGFADGGVQVIRTPGNHQTFLKQYSREFGEQVRLCIDQARIGISRRVPDAAGSARRDGVVMPKVWTLSPNASDQS